MNISLEILYNLTSIFYKGKIVIEKINEKQNILNDNIGFVENWDFSRANLNEENRILAITQVASICYQNPKALGSESLYNRLMAESMGLPSSSFEFVPVLLDYENPKHQEILKLEYSNCKKFGEILDDRYLLTNYRALVYDFENDKDKFSFDIRTIFNTQEECKIIKEHFKVFLFKVDLPTRSQMVRHRVSWQELCISGDSIITTSQGKQTIKDMFDKQERQRLKYNSVKYPSVKCYDEVARKFTTTKVKEIFYTGKKEVFELVISASGKTKKIKATKDHKFLTKDGWKRLEEIKESDFVALNGQPLYRDKEWLKEQKEIFLNNKIGLQGMSKSLNINYNTLRKWLKIHNLQYTQKEISSTYEIWNKGVTGKESHSYGQSKNNETRQKISEKLSKPLGYSRGGFRKRVTTYWSAEFRKTPLLKKFNNCCNICEASTNLEIDHILPVTTNPELAFNEDNIQILCKDCHREKTRLENSSNRQTIKWGFVTNIK